MLQTYAGPLLLGLLGVLAADQKLQHVMISADRLRNYAFAFFHSCADLLVKLIADLHCWDGCLHCCIKPAVAGDWYA